MNKEKIVIIEGIDRAGKDSVRREIIKQTEGKTLVIIRAFISQIAYSRIYNRKINEEYFFDKAKQLANLGAITTYLFANRSDILQRIIDTNEKHISEYQIVSHQKIFDDVVKEFETIGLEIYHFDSSNQKPDEIAKIISLL